jgi:hypothetical protein
LGYFTYFSWILSESPPIPPNQDEVVLQYNIENVLATEKDIASITHKLASISAENRGSVIALFRVGRGYFGRGKLRKNFLFFN